MNIISVSVKLTNLIQQCRAKAFALSLALLVGAPSILYAQIPTRWATNGNFEDFIVGGVYTSNPNLSSVGLCGTGWNANGFVATVNNNSAPNVQVAGWRSTDGNAVSAPLGISSAGGNFNNCGTINLTSGWTEIFGTGTTNYWNHNNPNNKARTYQNLCILPSDTPYYGLSTRARNDVNERLALGICPRQQLEQLSTRLLWQLPETVSAVEICGA